MRHRLLRLLSFQWKSKVLSTQHNPKFSDWPTDADIITYTRITIYFTTFRAVNLVNKLFQWFPCVFSLSLSCDYHGILWPHYNIKIHPSELFNEKCNWMDCMKNRSNCTTKDTHWLWNDMHRSGLDWFEHDSWHMHAILVFIIEKCSREGVHVVFGACWLYHYRIVLNSMAFSVQVANFSIHRTCFTFRLLSVHCFRIVICLWPQSTGNSFPFTWADLHLKFTNQNKI